MKTSPCASLSCPPRPNMDPGGTGRSAAAVVVSAVRTKIARKIFCRLELGAYKAGKKWSE